MLNKVEINLKGPPTEKHQNDNPSNLSVLAYKLDTLQNFFLTEISDIRAEIENKSLQKTAKNKLFFSPKVRNSFPASSLTQSTWCTRQSLRNKMICNVYYIHSRFWQHLVQEDKL